MKKLLITGLVGLSLVVGANASVRDTTVNVYGVGAKTDKNQDSSAGAGIMLDSENVKVKLEATSDFIKTGAVLKFNPLEKYYIKVGLNYLNQKMYAPDNTNAKVNQYSGALGTGYMISNDLYIELGGSITQLDGSKVGADYEVKDETTSLTYLEVAKRWFDVLDTTANAGQVFHEFSNDEFSYGVGVDYYPTNNSKLGFNYQNEKNNIVSVYSAQYGYLFAEYVDNISSKTNQVNAGFKIAFTDITDFSTYSMPKNIKPHLSELHRFESIAFGTNMEIQSSAGVSKTAEAIARDNTPAISSPTISLANQSVNDNGGFITTDLPAPTVSNVNAGAVYSIVGDPTGGKLTINAGTGVATWDGDLGGDTDYSITIKVLNTDGGTSSTTFTLTVIDNG
ncbi:cadherin repeat domain-containing protein [Sulfurimonas sp.]|uniref:cadherin repeat domain-containing protein n=1 Tax=Sulfurimonas sp. TaxID=2022749 RepID=UPI0025D5ACAC|nr:cadherin repeat domain-containing protein [Sulfurimonas sp.]MBT5934090.1 cadherin repeat domain-containing protein [Sulfurimonas sp.]